MQLFEQAHKISIMTQNSYNTQTVQKEIKWGLLENIVDLTWNLLASGLEISWYGGKDIEVL